MSLRRFWRSARVREIVLRLRQIMRDALDEWIGMQPGKEKTRRQAVYLFIRDRLGIDG